MTDSPAQRALAVSALALLGACAAGTGFLPPLAEQTWASTPRALGLGLALAGGLLLHWVSLALAARRLDRSVPGWLAMAVCLTPIGGAAALSVLGFFAGDRAGRPASHSALAPGA
jgi:uncharacterized membrane protein YhaH (DUF805 family)